MGQRGRRIEEEQIEENHVKKKGVVVEIEKKSRRRYEPRDRH